MYIKFVGTWLIVVLVALSSFCISSHARLIRLGDTGGAQNPSRRNHNSRSNSCGCGGGQRRGSLPFSVALLGGGGTPWLWWSGLAW
jgi:hypothetical protein